MVKHIHVPIPNQRSKSATSHVVEEGAVRTALTIYSAGTTFMSFFTAENRYLTRGARLMIHERKLDKQLQINGPLTTCVATVTAALHEIEASIAIQNEGFENLIRGSEVTMEEVLSRAPGNWYIEANEAKSLGLVAGVL